MHWDRHRHSGQRQPLCELMFTGANMYAPEPRRRQADTDTDTDTGGKLYQTVTATSDKLHTHVYCNAPDNATGQSHVTVSTSYQLSSDTH